MNPLHKKTFHLVFRLCTLSLLYFATFSLLTGCQSQTDEFISQIDQDIQDQQTIMEQQSGSNTNNLSEQLLAGGAQDTTSTERGIYTDYSASGYDAARQSGKQIVFFSHSPSSPISLALDTSINTNRSRIPVDVAIFKLDYDTSLDLNQQYTITEPDTIIVFDTNSEIKHQVAGGIYKIESLLKYL